jgi:hypothetical protein
VTSTLFILVLLAFSDEVASAARLFTLPRETAAAIYLAGDFLILMLLLRQRLRFRRALDREPPRKLGRVVRNRVLGPAGIGLVLFADFLWLKPFFPEIPAWTWTDWVVPAVVGVVGAACLVIATTTTKSITAWWWLGAVLMLFTDFYWIKPLNAGLTMGNVLDDLVLAVGSAIAVLILFATAIDVSPRLVLSRKRRADEPDGWAGLAAAMPLLVGIFFAYLAAVWWELALEPLSEKGVPQSESAVDAQFFAQASQVLPLLILAIGFEIRIFKDATETQRAAAIVSLTFLCAGEVLALSVLAKPGNSASFDWHVYSTFVVVVTAGLVGITTIVGALLTRTRPPEKRSEPAVKAQTVDGGERWYQAVAIGVLTTAFVAALFRRRDGRG